MPYRPAHAPIYGYMKGAAAASPLHLVHYARAFSILLLLNHFPFESMLNVGGGLDSSHRTLHPQG